MTTEQFFALDAKKPAAVKIPLKLYYPNHSKIEIKIIEY